jgi:hypothetical protein
MPWTTTTTTRRFFTQAAHQVNVSKTSTFTPHLCGSFAGTTLSNNIFTSQVVGATTTRDFSAKTTGVAFLRVR